MPKIIRQLREERGESTMQLAKVLGTTLQDIHDLETGVARPSFEQLRLLTRHFRVRQEDITLAPNRPPPAKTTEDPRAFILRRWHIAGPQRIGGVLWSADRHSAGVSAD